MKLCHLLPVSMVFVFVQLRKVKAEIAELSNNPQGLLLEAIQSAGYSGALANPLLAPETALDRLDASILEKFVAVRPKNLYQFVCRLLDYALLYNIFCLLFFETLSICIYLVPCVDQWCMIFEFQENYTAPRMVLAASGVEHEELISLAQPLLSDLPSVPYPEEPKSVYVGGDYRRQADTWVCVIASLQTNCHLFLSFPIT